MIAQTGEVGSTSICSTRGVRVLHLLDTDGFAGTERHVIDLMTSMQMSGAVFQLACRSGSPLHREADLRGLQASGCWEGVNPSNLLKGIFEVRKLAQTMEADLLHAHNGRTVLTAAIVAWYMGIKCIATQHFISPQFTTYGGIKRAVAGFAHNRVNSWMSHIICVSKAAQDSMLRRERIVATKTSVIHNGARGLSLPSNDNLMKVRRSLGVAEADPMIICVSRLAPEKGLEHLLNAIKLLQNDYPRLKLIIAGEGPDRQLLEERVFAQNLSAMTAFLGFRNDIAALVGAADIFVLPSPAEPFGLSILEAMSLAKPVVACNAGGPAEILTNRVDGMLVTPADPIALADAIRCLLTDSAFRKRLGTEARNTFDVRFRSAQMAESTLAVYDLILRSGP